MTLLTVKNGVAAAEVIPYTQAFDGVHILRGEGLEYFKRYLEDISAPIADCDLLCRYFDAWCTRHKHVEGLAKLSAAALRNAFVCEAHNEVLRTEARVLFEGKSEELSSLSSDIAELQSMKIPERLVNGKLKAEN